jgi:sec-independent protein translocase protein TatC
MATEAEPSELQGHMTLMEHIAELRTRLLRAVIAVAVGAVIAWFLYDPLLHFLLGPLRQLSPDEDLANRLLTTDPLEPFSVRIKITTYTGIMLAMPVILWQLWRFISPGLYSNEKKYAVWFVVVGSMLFFLGAAIAFWTVPKALEFLETIGGEDNFNQFYAPGKYLRLITYMMLAFGIGFEFPILLVFLQMAGIVTVGRLRQFRRYAIVGLAVIVAVATPSADPISMLALLIPMIFFYEAAIIYGRIRERRRRKAAAQV